MGSVANSPLYVQALVQVLLYFKTCLKYVLGTPWLGYFPFNFFGPPPLQWVYFVPALCRGQVKGRVPAVKTLLITHTILSILAIPDL